MNTSTVVIGTDHAGVDFKNALKLHIQELGFTVKDIGVNSADSCDYPLKAAELCRDVLATDSIGILICGTGMGMSMTANRFSGIRAALCTNEYLARMARAHNNANVLCLGSRALGIELAKGIVSTFLATKFEGQRHLRRVEQIDNLGPA